MRQSISIVPLVLFEAVRWGHFPCLTALYLVSGAIGRAGHLGDEYRLTWTIHLPAISGFSSTTAFLTQTHRNSPTQIAQHELWLPQTVWGIWWPILMNCTKQTLRIRQSKSLILTSILNQRQNLKTRFILRMERYNKHYSWLLYFLFTFIMVCWFLLKNRYLHIYIPFLAFTVSFSLF